MTSTTLPSVREQVTRWTSGRSKKATDEAGRETLDARNLEILGRVGRSTFATHGGRELKVRGPVAEARIESAPADAVLVRQPVRAADGRTGIDTYIATVVDAGTFEKVQRQKAYRPKERRPSPLDGLAELRKPAARQVVTLDSSDDGSPEAVVMGALSRRPLLLMTDSRNAPATVRRLIEVANAAGANLRHHNGRTLCDWSTLRRWNALLVASWPLVHAHMAGKPLQCAYEHEGDAPPAATLDPVGVPVCNACVGWEPNAA